MNDPRHEIPKSIVPASADPRASAGPPESVDMAYSVGHIKTQFPATGTVKWMGVRHQKGAPVETVQSLSVTVANGAVGDRFSGKPGSKRQVTLIQFEHLPVIADLLGRSEVRPEWLRRNIAVAGINLTALKGTTFEIGSAILLGTGACAPCSKMEHILGPGGFNAMRGHGGITASVIRDGEVQIGDEVRFLGLANPGSSPG